MYEWTIYTGDLINVQTGVMMTPGKFPSEIVGVWEVLGFLKAVYDPNNKEYYSIVHPWDDHIVLKSIIETEGCYSHALAIPHVRTSGMSNRIEVSVSLTMRAYGSSFDALVRCVGDYRLVEVKNRAK